MEIRAHGPAQRAAPLAVTMRTPGNDFELAVGFCHSEGVLRGSDDLAEVAYCLEGEGEQHYNVVTVRLRHPFDAAAHARAFAATASCGLCGKATLDQIEVDCGRVADGPVVSSEVLARLPDTLREAQTVFDATGGLHAAALFDPEGTLRCMREDVGRHNAVDKVIGHEVLEGDLPLRDTILLVSGRVSFELVQKAAVAGIPILCAVSAPSSLAVDAARRFGQTVVGFLRGSTCNVYSGAERVDVPGAR